MSKTHVLKCWSSNFDLLVDRSKSFEVRENDRDFAIGDRLVLVRWDPATHRPAGAFAVVGYVSSMVQGKFGLPPRVCVLGWREGTLQHQGADEEWLWRFLRGQAVP